MPLTLLSSSVALRLCKQAENLQVEVDDANYKRIACVPLILLGQAVFNGLADGIKVTHQQDSCDEHADSCKEYAYRAVIDVDYALHDRGAG